MSPTRPIVPEPIERSYLLAARALVVPTLVVAAYVLKSRLVVVVSPNTLRLVVAGCVALLCLGFTRPPPKLPTIWGYQISLSVGVALVAHEVMAILDFEPGIPVTRVNGQVSADFISTAVIAPFAEEWVFRVGILLALIVGLTSLGSSHRLATLIAVVASSAAFGFVHGPGDWSVMAPTAIGGLIYAAAFLQSGTLWAPLLVHAISNASIFAPHKMISSLMFAAPLLIAIYTMTKNKPDFDRAFETEHADHWWVRAFARLSS